jgi:hypothetical protein
VAPHVSGVASSRVWMAVKVWRCLPYCSHTRVEGGVGCYHGGHSSPSSLALLCAGYLTGRVDGPVSLCSSSRKQMEMQP